MVTRKLTACTVLLAVLAAVLVIPAMAGNIEGYVYNPFRSVQSSLSISADRDGNFYPAGFGQATTWEATPVGWYGMSGLAPGVYQMLLHESDNWPRKILFGISVPASGTTYVDHRIDYPNMETGIFWDGNLRTEWCQSFVATGKSLVQVGYSQAIEFGPDTTISIHEGTPDGPQIGPSKIIPTVVVNPSSAYWSHGEVPLVPGKEYVVKFRVNEGHRPFLGVGRIQGGIAFPDGRTWFDGNLAADPIRMTLCQDDDGIITVVSTKKTNSASLPLSYRSVRTVGQTFKAKGSSMLSVSLLVGSTAGQKLEATVHDGPGLSGEGGPQIGFGKFIKPVDWNERSGAVWKQGEVPLQEGHEYYVKIKRSDSQPFTVYYVNQNEYQDGVLYLDNFAQTDAELSTTITAEEFSGSATRAKVKIQNISVTRSTTSATITWNTDVATTTNYAEYAARNPYRYKVNDSAGGTSHSVTITGLAPNTLYHYRVVSKAANYWDGYSRDFVFVTEPDSTNLLQNASFEAGTEGPWVEYGGGDCAVRNGWPPGAYPDWFGATAHEGSSFYGGVCNGLKLYSGIYQQVQTTPGMVLKARAWMWTWQMDTFGAFLTWTVHGRIGIDPTGGTDPASPSIVWSPMTVAQDLFNDAKGVYCEAWARAIAANSTITIFIEGGSETATAWTIFAFDDLVLTETAPVEVADLASAKSQTDGTAIRFADKVVVGTPLLTGAAYVEEEDRCSGIRVETGASIEVGDRISAVGFKETKASGEPFLADASVLTRVPGPDLKPVQTVAKNAGNGTGLPTTGMLMRVCGKVSMDDNLNFFINDQSLPGLGIKINIANLSMWPEFQQTYGITGVVSLTGATPSTATAIITPRWDQDVQIQY